jgi:hypothetical protein
VHPTARKLVIGEGGVGAYEHILLDRHPIPELNSALDRYAVSYGHVILNEGMVAEIAICSDTGAGQDMRESPYARPRPHLAGLYHRERMFEKVH